MSNMSYCRFENTLNDLAECYQDFEEELSSESEIEARKELVALCKQISENYDGVELPEETEDEE